ncbi:MAG: RluA family pseudouridine synthase [Lachnospiraceae bacterium]|nr:RluA family pseudouridine synthase [Lachnospiraceae bacterium]
MKLNSIVVSDEDDLIRIDKFIANVASDLTRSRIQGLISDGNITVNDKVVKANYKVREQDIIKILIPDAVPVDIPAEDIPLDIVYEDDDILIVNKPKGMVVHPAPGHYTGTLVNALMYHCKDNLSGINGELRPGIVHRIDMDTTGLLVVCKNDKAHNFVAEQLKEHSITRKYQAIVYNAFKDEEGVVEGNIGRHPNDRKKMTITPNGKEAITHYKVLKNMGKYTLIECQLETGRTHQIRVHMSSINHPLLGDEIYGPKNCPFKLQGQVLHAKTLGFIHPTTKEYMEFDSELPAYFTKLIDTLSNQQ